MLEIHGFRRRHLHLREAQLINSATVLNVPRSLLKSGQKMKEERVVNDARGNFLFLFFLCFF